MVSAADQLEADKIVGDLMQDGAIGSDNVITQALDRAFTRAKKWQRKNINERANILIVGLPGSGKTASVYD